MVRLATYPASAPAESTSPKSHPHDHAPRRMPAAATRGPEAVGDKKQALVGHLTEGGGRFHKVNQCGGKECG